MFTNPLKSVMYPPFASPFGGDVAAPDVPFSNSLYVASEDATTPWYTSTQFNAFYDAAVDKTFMAQEVFFPPPSKRFAKVRAFDHATGLWGDAWSAGPESQVANDDHGAPSIALNADGRLVCSWGNHDGDFRLSVSLNAHDEKTWGTSVLLTGRYAYPHLVLLPSGTMICLLRKDVPAGGTYPAGAKILVYRPITFVGSVPTVGAEVVVGDLGNDSRWYQGNCYLRPDGYIHQVATRADYNDTVRLNAYYYKIDIAGQRLLSINDTAVAFPVTNTDMTNTFKIYTTAGGNTSNTPAFVFDASGRKHVLTHEGGTADAGGTDAAPQTLKYLIAAAAGTSFVGPTDVGASTQRYNAETIVPMSDGGVRMLWNKDKNNLNIRGGAVQYRDLAAGAAASTFGPEKTLMDHDTVNGRGPLSAVVTPLFADSDIRALWSEIGTTSNDSGAGERRVYAWGDAGMKAKAKPSLILPPALTGDGFWIDLSDLSDIFADVGMTTPPADLAEILRIRDAFGTGNILVGTAGTTPILDKIGGQNCIRFGGASSGSKFMRQAAKVWTTGNGFMCTAIFRHWMNTTSSRTLLSLDAGVGNARVATLANANGKQLRAIGFSGTVSTILASAASEYEYGNDYILQAYTVGSNLHMYVNGNLVQTSAIGGGALNASSVALTLGGTSETTPTGFFTGACFGAVFRTGHQTTQMRDSDLAWARTQLPN